MTIDTSGEAVERVAAMLDAWTADGVRGDAQQAAALLRALVAGRDHWKATFHARYVEDVRDTKDAYARGWREGAETMREKADKRVEDMWDEKVFSVYAESFGDGWEAACKQAARAIRALSLPEPQA